MEDPIKMDDLGVPLFLKTHIYSWAILIFGSAWHAAVFGGMKFPTQL